MGDIIEINHKRFFTIDQARVLLPVVRRVTRSAFTDVKVLSAQLSYTNDKTKRETVEEKIRRIFEEWQGKIQKLGCEAKGMWLVDFDNGEGYYCWHYPESDIDYFHSYSEGFRGRTKLN